MTERDSCVHLITISTFDSNQSLIEKFFSSSSLILSGVRLYSHFQITCFKCHDSFSRHNLHNIKAKIWISCKNPVYNVRCAHREEVTAVVARRVSNPSDQKQNKRAVQRCLVQRAHFSPFFLLSIAKLRLSSLQVHTHSYLIYREPSPFTWNNDHFSKQNNWRVTFQR